MKSSIAMCRPKIESRALFEVVKSRSRRGLWYEWESFCLTISFGPTVLGYLKSKLEDLNKAGKVFALAILHRNRMNINEKFYKQLVLGLLEDDYWSLDSNEPELSILGANKSVDILKGYLNREMNKKTRTAAKQLLRYHYDDLSLELEAKCITFVAEEGPSGFPGFIDVIERLAKNPEFAEAVKQISNQLIERGDDRPLLDFFHLAFQKPKHWWDIVDKLVCFDPEFIGQLKYEINARWLLDYGRIKKKHGKEIGKAAKAHLKNAVKKWDTSKPHRIEQMYYLAILSHEFIGLAKRDVENVLTRGNAIHTSGACALLARLGKVPKGYQKRDSKVAVPDLSD